MIKRLLSFILVILISISTESCSTQDPSEQMMELLVQYIEILKSTRINTQRDIDELKEKIDALNEKKDGVKMLEMQMMQDMSQEEIEEYSLNMIEKMERSGILKICEQETDRITKEAKNAGLGLTLF